MNEPQPRQETLHVKGNGRISIRSFRGANALFVDGKPIALDWGDCAGSIGHHFYHAEIMTSCERRNYLRETVSDTANVTKSLANTFRPLLCEFPSGNYELVLSALESDWQMYSWDQHTLWQSQGWYYPYPYNMPVIVPTQPLESLSDSRVLEFMYRIEKGERPFSITAAGSCNHASIEFVIDGHHKLLAYCEMGLPPWRMRIAAQDYPLLSYDDWPEGVDVPVSWNLQFNRERTGDRK